MQEQADYQDLLELFREMLQHAKNKYLNQEELTSIDSDIFYNKVNELYEKNGMIHFPEAFFALHQYLSKT